MRIPKRRSYSGRPEDSAPFTDEEDEKIVEITRIDLSSHLWPEALPGRRFGEIVERRLQLIEQGKCPRPRSI